jgi:hypothetical protein
MINFSQIRTTIKTFLENQLTNSIAYLSQNNRPSYNEDSGNVGNPYFTFRGMSIVKIGDDYKLPPDVNGSAEIVGDREFTLRIKCVGENAVWILEDIYSKIRTFDNSKLFIDNNFIIVDLLGSIQSVNEIVKTKYKEMAVMDLLCRVASVIVDDNAGIIESVTVVGTLKNDDIVNRTLNINVN